jgi:hypothetical protein
VFAWACEAGQLCTVAIVTKISLSKLDYLVSTRYNQCEQCPSQTIIKIAL